MFTSRTALDVKFQHPGYIYGKSFPPKTYNPPICYLPRPPTQKKTGGEKKLFPKDAPPKSLALPFVSVTDEVADSRFTYAETDSFTKSNIMNKARKRKGQAITPGWLVDLTDAQLNGIMDIENVLKDFQKPEPTVAALDKIINEKLKISVPKEEICNILFLCDVESTGQDSLVSRFIFAMGNVDYAKARGVVKASAKMDLDCSPIPNRENCGKGEEERPGTGDEPAEDSKDGLKKYPLSTDACDQDFASPTKTDITGYSAREKVFYSGLLILHMFKTLKGVEELYFQSWIPEPVAKISRRRKLIDSIGMRKHGFAEWDRTVPPLPKVSPYCSIVPFVTTRWKVVKPNRDEKGRRRTLNELMPVHLVVEPPTSEHYAREFNEPIRITENRYRIKQALEYLASKGDCVALLPNISFIIHLSDTFIDKLEERSMHTPKFTRRRERVYSGNEVISIAKEARALYRPHGIPKQVSQLKSLIKYTDALHLRKILGYIQKQHWDYISRLKLEFRQSCWEKMHVEDMQEGRVKQSFIHAFVTYLPYKSHLPIHHHHNANPS